MYHIFCAIASVFWASQIQYSHCKSILGGLLYYSLRVPYDIAISDLLLYEAAPASLHKVPPKTVHLLLLPASLFSPFKDLRPFAKIPPRETSYPLLYPPQMNRQTTRIKQCQTYEPKGQAGRKEPLPDFRR